MDRGPVRFFNRHRGGPRAAWWAALYAVLAASPLLVMLVGVQPPPRGFQVELAAALGYVALAMVSLQLVLGARPRLIVNGVGLDAILLFHRAAALWVTALVTAHLTLLAIREPGFVTHLLALRARPPHGVVLWLALAGLALLVLVPRQLSRLRIPYETWRVAHALVAVGVVTVALWHVRSVGRSIATLDKRLAVTAFVALAASSLFAARALRPARALRHPYRVAQVREERAQVRTIVLEAVNHGGLCFEPGQSVWLTLGRTPFSPRQHPFTVASSAASPRRLEITVKELGDFTRDIGRTPPGTRAYLAGPYGAFGLDVEAPRPLVCIAGGIGVTPMMSMLRTLRDRGDPRRVVLLYGSGSLDEVVFADELAELTRALNLRVVHVLASAPPEWTGEQGLITGDVLDRHADDMLDDAEIFVCGPEAMMNLVERALHARGVRRTRVHTEHFAIVGSRPPGGRSARERHVRAAAAGVALSLVAASSCVALIRG